MLNENDIDARQAGGKEKMNFLYQDIIPNFEI